MTETHYRLPPGLLVALGGFSGAVARYGVDVAVGASLQSTLAVNVVGSFALGLVLTALLDANPGDSSIGRSRLRRFGATGFLSSFTTYSTFVVGTIQQTPAMALGYVIVSYAAGFAAAGVGIGIAANWNGERR